MDAQTKFLAEIESFCRRHDVSAKRFGQQAAKDPNFVSDIRNGRSPSLRTVERIRKFMTAYGRDRAA